MNLTNLIAHYRVMPLCAAAVALMLGGCAPSQWDSATTLAIAEKKAFSDQERKLLFEAPCAATIGSLLRMGSNRKREAVLTLCEAAD